MKERLPMAKATLRERGQLLTVEEAAPRLGMKAATVRREIRAGRLKVLRRGRSIGIYESWLEEYVETHTQQARIETGSIEAERTSERPTGIKDLLPRTFALRVN